MQQKARSLFSKASDIASDTSKTALALKSTDTQKQDGGIMEQHENPIVFISYSQDSVAFADQVLAFSNKLRGEGIDTILDQYEEAPAEGWPRWMENSINRADYVVVIGSKGYYDKIYGHVEQGKGRGVKWEGNIIYQKLYMSDSVNTKFIPVVFDEKDLEYVPTPLQGSTYYNVSSKAGFDKLYWRLRGVPTKEKPPLGKLRPLPEKERKTLLVSSLIDIETWDKAVWRGAGFLFGYTPLPTLLLPFANEKYATKIFEDWISVVGQDDTDEEIRIAFVEGAVQGEPAGYYIVVGNNLDQVVKRAEKSGTHIDDLMIFNVSRIIRANPKDNFQLFNYFKKAYETTGEYMLMPAIVDERTGQIKPLSKLRIHKRKLIYRNIADITENDEDAILLDKNKPFKPYIPKKINK